MSQYKELADTLEWLAEGYWEAKIRKAIAILRGLDAQEPFGRVTVRRLSQRFTNHHDQYHFYPAGQPPYLDNVDEVYALYAAPVAAQPRELTQDESAVLRGAIFDSCEVVAAQPQQAKPLSEEWRTRIVRANKKYHDSDEVDPYGVIDDVEAAHGIKEQG